MTTTKAQDQPIERLVYTSRAAVPMGTLALFNLLSHARQKNARLGITGHLLYADGMFTQCIEGPPDAIASLWTSLVQDPRHDTIAVIERGQVGARRFAEWDMAFSSYRCFSELEMPGFFPLDANGESEKSRLCRE